MIRAGRTWAGVVGPQGGLLHAADGGETRRIVRIAWTRARRALRTRDPGASLARRVDGASVVLLVAGPRVRPDPAALAAILAGLPRPATRIVALAHPGWEDDAIHALLRAHVVLLAAEIRPGDTDPVLRRTGPGVALHVHPGATDGPRWAARLAAFTGAGYDAWIVRSAPAVGHAAGANGAGGATGSP